MRVFDILTLAHIRIPSSLGECFKEAYLRALQRYFFTFDSDTLFVITGTRWVDEIQKLDCPFGSALIVCRETDDPVRRINNVTIITCRKGATERPLVEHGTCGSYTVVVTYGSSFPNVDDDLYIDFVIAATTSDVFLPEEIDRTSLLYSRHYPEAVMHSCIHLRTHTSHRRIVARMSELLYDKDSDSDFQVSDDDGSRSEITTGR